MSVFHDQSIKEELKLKELKKQNTQYTTNGDVEKAKTTCFCYSSMFASSLVLTVHLKFLFESPHGLCLLYKTMFPLLSVI